MPDIAGHSVNYVHDALKERLPHDWSLAREESKETAFYRWTKWKTAEFVVLEIHESYATDMNVGQLCDQVMEAVFTHFGDFGARANTPLAERMRVLDTVPLVKGYNHHG